MIKRLETKNTDARLIIEKKVFGIGVHLDFDTIHLGRNRRFLLIIDLIFVRFWLNVFKKEVYL
jgi:hypothetical protein